MSEAAQDIPVGIAASNSDIPAAINQLSITFPRQLLEKENRAVRKRVAALKKVTEALKQVALLVDEIKQIENEQCYKCRKKLI